MLQAKEKASRKFLRQDHGSQIRMKEVSVTGGRLGVVGGEVWMIMRGWVIRVFINALKDCAFYLVEMWRQCRFL